MSESRRPGPDTQMAMKAVEAGLLTQGQLAEVRRELAKKASPPSLADALIARGLLTRMQVEGFQSGGLAPRIGKYRLLRELGRGGMGVVYEAEDVELKRRCALKTMIEAEGIDARERAVEEERFVREARLSANLPRHEGIVGVYDAGVVDGRRVIAMELVEGLQFQDWRKKAGATLRQQVQVLMEVADAVAHAHEHGVIHRDLKPSNILVDARRRPRVTDFGLAKRSRETTVFSLTASGMIVGTPAYMSPEQAEAKDEVGPSTDQWALGVMLYEILAGRLPFRGDSAVEVLMKTVKDPVVPPTQILRSKGSVDERLERVCMRALKKSTAERWPSVRSFADQLGGWLKGGTVRKAPARKRTPWIPVAAGALLAAAALFFVFRPSGTAAVDVRALVADGRRLIEKKKYADALIAFGRALAEDPANADAKAGKKEAERLLTAGAPEPPLVAALRKRIADGDILGAQSLLDGEEGRRLAEPGRSELKTSLRKRMEQLFEGHRDRATAAKSRKDPKQIEAMTKEVDSWRQPDLSAALRTALEAVKPAPPDTGGSSDPRQRYHFAHGRNGVAMLAFSPDSRRLLSGSFMGLTKLWDLPSQGLVLEIDDKGEHRTIAADFSRDGRWIATSWADGKVLVYDAKAPEKPPRLFKGHTAQAFGAAFSPDSTRLFTCSVEGPARMWTVADGVERSSKPLSGSGMSLACAPDGKTVAIGTSNGEIQFWEVAPGGMSNVLSPRSGTISSLAYAPDGARLASGVEKGELLLWDLKTGASRLFARHGTPLHKIAWSPDGRWIAAAADRVPLRVWNASTGAEVADFKVPGGDADGWYAVAFSPDGKLLAGGTYNWQVRVFDATALGK